jgi:hypothetical protein
MFLFQDFDETVLERLVGLTEMFPTCLQVATAKLFYGTFSSAKGDMLHLFTMFAHYFSILTIFLIKVFIPLLVLLHGLYSAHLQSSLLQLYLKLKEHKWKKCRNNSNDR